MLPGGQAMPSHDPSNKNDPMNNYHIIDLVGEGSFGKVSGRAGAARAWSRIPPRPAGQRAPPGSRQHTTPPAPAGVQGPAAVHRPNHGHEIHHEARQERQGHQKPAPGAPPGGGAPRPLPHRAALAPGHQQALRSCPPPRRTQQHNAHRPLLAAAQRALPCTPGASATPIRSRAAGADPAQRCAAAGGCCSIAPRPRPAQEIEILRQLRHEHIIQMLDAFETKTDFCVVTGAC